MKKLLLSCVAAATAASIVLAAPTDDVKAAARKLADASNYSWSTNTQMGGGGGGGGGRGGFGGGPMSAVTEKDGYTVITREFNGNSMQTVRKGEQVVMQNQQGEWVTMQEMMAQFGNRGGGNGGQGGAGRRGGGQGGAQGGGQGGGRRGGGGFGGFGGGFNPAEEVAALAEAATDLKSADGAIVGTLPAEAVARRLTFGGRGGGGGDNGPTNTSGSVKFWLKDGAIVKYELHVKGTVSFGGQEREIDRTTTTEIKDVGSTKVTVPEDAKKKLGA